MQLPVCLGRLEGRGLEAHGAEVVVLTVVDVRHGRVLQTLGQLLQRPFRWEDKNAKDDFNSE